MRWKDVRAEYVERAGGERAVEAGKQELLATAVGHRLARRRHRSEAELIREAIDTLLLAEPVRPKPRLPLFTGVDHTLADRVDEILAEGFGADGLR